MMDVLLRAGQRLAEALLAENAALAKLDLAQAGQLAGDKIRATDAFAAAAQSCQKLGTRAEGPERSVAQALTAQIADLGAENRRLLQRAIALQSRVIETIAQAALPAANPLPGYAALARRPIQQPASALALSARI
ncbi:MAG TPA: hypothetical protein VGM87_07610 [Roseomonas sp.]|jgi:hypothetical protein